MTGLQTVVWCDCSLSGKAMGCMAQIYLYNDSFADAWSVLFTAGFFCILEMFFSSSGNSKLLLEKLTIS